MNIPTKKELVDEARGYLIGIEAMESPERCEQLALALIRAAKLIQLTARRARKD